MATASIQRTPMPTGIMTTAATGGTAPATRQAGNPYSITSPATGTATRLATVPTADNRPNTTRLGSATPIWAPTVIATGRASGPRRASRGSSNGPIAVTPNVAPTDSQKPTDQVSSGSSRTRAMTASASSRTGWRWRPSRKAVALKPAIVAARRTDGSARVSTTNQPINVNVASHRGTGRARRSSGPAAAITNATFWPETAVKCARPLARNRSIISGG